jgi:hypothetical protein
VRAWTALTTAVLVVLGTAPIAAADPPPLNIRFGPPPPNGPFLAVSHVGSFFAFVVDGSTTRQGSVADVWFYEIEDPPTRVGRQTASQLLEHMSFDCAKRSVRELGHWVYDDADNEIGALDSDKPSPPWRMGAGDHEDLRSRYVCEGMTLDVEVKDRAAARALAKRMKAVGE